MSFIRTNEIFKFEIAMPYESEFQLPIELQSSIFRDWGLHLKRHHALKSAINQFQKSREAKENARSIIQLCKCSIEFGAHREVLRNVELCMELYPKEKEAMDLQRDSVYYLNELEETTRLSHNIRRRFPQDGTNISFVKTCNLYIKRATSMQAGRVLRHFVRNRKITAVNKNGEDRSDEGNKIMKLSSSAQWKLQIINRRKHYFDGDILRQMNYWSGIVTNNSHILNQYQESSNRLSKIIASSQRIFFADEESLWTKNPSFSKPNVILARQKQCRISNTFQLQDTVIGKQLTELEQITKTAELTPIIHHVKEVLMEPYIRMPDDVILHQSEIIKQIYIAVGWVILKKIIEIPHIIMDLEPIGRMLCLLKINEKNSIHEKSKISSKFGDQQEYQNTIFRERAEKRFTKRTEYLMKQLKKCNIPLKVAYLQYQLAYIYFTQGRLSESCKYGEEVVMASKRAENILWEFLGNVAILRTHAQRNNFFKIKSLTKDIIPMAMQLNKFVLKYIEVIKWVAVDFIDNNKSSN